MFVKFLPTVAFWLSFCFDYCYLLVLQFQNDGVKAWSFHIPNGMEFEFVERKIITKKKKIRNRTAVEGNNEFVQHLFAMHTHNENDYKFKYYLTNCQNVKIHPRMNTYGKRWKWEIFSIQMYAFALLNTNTITVPFEIDDKLLPSAWLHSEHFWNIHKLMVTLIYSQLQKTKF